MNQPLFFHYNGAHIYIYLKNVFEIKQYALIQIDIFDR